MHFELSETELASLRKIQKESGFQRRRYIKATVLIMLDGKVSPADISSFLGIDDNTVYRYADSYRTVDLPTYLSDGFVPYQGKLNQEQERVLSDHLETFCYPNAKSICHYIQQTFGISYTPSGLVPLLHRLGFRYKQTKVVPGKAEESAQLAFLQKRLPQLVEAVKSGQAELYYADGSHPTHNTIRSKGWIKQGETFEILGNSGRQRLNINAAINAFKPTQLVFNTPAKINAQSTQNLCKQLLQKHRRKTIYLICDNARYNHNRWLKEWTAGTRVELVFLPTYSPNLNLIERLWRFLKQKIINSTYCEKFGQFKEEIVSFLSDLKPYKEELQSLLTLHFRTVEGTSVYSQTT